MEAVIESGSSTSEQRSRGGGAAALSDWIAAWQPEDPAVQSATPGYSSTEYASTGTGTPVVVEEDYVFENPERRP